MAQRQPCHQRSPGVVGPEHRRPHLAPERQRPFLSGEVRPRPPAPERQDAAVARLAVERERRVGQRVVAEAHREQSAADRSVVRSGSWAVGHGGPITRTLRFREQEGLLPRRTRVVQVLRVRCRTGAGNRTLPMRVLPAQRYGTLRPRSPLPIGGRGLPEDQSQHRHCASVSVPAGRRPDYGHLPSLARSRGPFRGARIQSLAHQVRTHVRHDQRF